jgi:polynucleotide 5'-hydroxyl-kinase GRC3/NOL9
VAASGYRVAAAVRETRGAKLLGRQAVTADPRRKLHIPAAWEAAAAEIFERRLRTVLVIGGAAIGKTSFCRYLMESLLARATEVAFVDADIGQSNLGPPATVTLGYPISPLDFSAVQPAGYYFVGSTGPIGRFLPLVIGTANLAHEAHAAFVVIDTTGLVHGSGRVLKNYKIDAVRPDVIVAVERRNELASIRMANRHVPIIKIEPSRKAHGKDDYEKIDVRRLAYARHFSRANLLQLSLESVIFQRTLLFTGKPIEIDGAIYAERSSDGILIVGAPPVPPPDSQVLPTGFERNLLCGVADATGRCLGLGIIERIDFAGRTIALTTVVDQDKVRILQFGDLYVTPEGGELGQVKWVW